MARSAAKQGAEPAKPTAKAEIKPTEQQVMLTKILGTGLTEDEVKGLVRQVKDVTGCKLGDEAILDILHNNGYDVNTAANFIFESKDSNPSEEWTETKRKGKKKEEETRPPAPRGLPRAASTDARKGKEGRGERNEGRSHGGDHGGKRADHTKADISTGANGIHADAAHHDSPVDTPSPASNTETVVEQAPATGWEESPADASQVSPRVSNANGRAPATTGPGRGGRGGGWAPTTRSGVVRARATVGQGRADRGDRDRERPPQANGGAGAGQRGGRGRRDGREKTERQEEKVVEQKPAPPPAPTWANLLFKKEEPPKEPPKPKTAQAAKQQANAKKHEQAEVAPAQAHHQPASAEQQQHVDEQHVGETHAHANTESHNEAPHVDTHAVETVAESSTGHEPQHVAEETAHEIAQGLEEEEHATSEVLAHAHAQAHAHAHAPPAEVVAPAPAPQPKPASPVLAQPRVEKQEKVIERPTTRSPAPQVVRRQPVAPSAPVVLPRALEIDSSFTLGLTFGMPSPSEQAPPSPKVKPMGSPLIAPAELSAPSQSVETIPASLPHPPSQPSLAPGAPPSQAQQPPAQVPTASTTATPLLPTPPKMPESAEPAAPSPMQIPSSSVPQQAPYMSMGHMQQQQVQGAQSMSPPGVQRTTIHQQQHQQQQQQQHTPGVFQPQSSHGHLPTEPKQFIPGLMAQSAPQPSNTTQGTNTLPQQQTPQQPTPQIQQQQPQTSAFPQPGSFQQQPAPGTGAGVQAQQQAGAVSANQNAPQAPPGISGQAGPAQPATVGMAGPSAMAARHRQYPQAPYHGMPHMPPQPVGPQQYPQGPMGWSEDPMAAAYYPPQMPGYGAPGWDYGYDQRSMYYDPAAYGRAPAGGREHHPRGEKFRNSQGGSATQHETASQHQMPAANASQQAGQGAMGAAPGQGGYGMAYYGSQYYAPPGYMAYQQPYQPMGGYQGGYAGHEDASQGYKAYPYTQHTQQAAAPATGYGATGGMAKTPMNTLATASQEYTQPPAAGYESKAPGYGATQPASTGNLGAGASGSTPAGAAGTAAAAPGQYYTPMGGAFPGQQHFAPQMTQQQPPQQSYPRQYWPGN